MNTLIISLYALVGTILGILWHYGISTRLTLALLFLIIFCIGLRVRTPILYIFTLFFAFYITILRNQYLENNYHKLYCALRKSTQVSGVILGIQKNPKTSLCTLDIATLKNYRFIVHIPEDPECEIGKKIVISPIRFAIKKDPSFERYLQKEGIIAMLFPSKKNYFIYSPKLGLIDRIKIIFYKIKIQVYMRATSSLTKIAHDLLSTIFFGYKSKDFDQMLIDSCAKWGIAHQLARSGLHLILFIALWGFFIAFLPISFVQRQFIIAALTGLYVTITWQTISILRAFIMFILYQITLINTLGYYPLHIFIITTLGTLFYNPLQIFFLDFQLSFALTGAIILFYHITKIPNQNFKKSLRKYMPFPYNK